MISDETLKNKPTRFKSFTGLSHRGVKQRRGAFARAYADAVTAQEAQRETPRRRRHGGGRKSTRRTLDDKLVFIRFDFTPYPIQLVQGYFFGLGAAQATVWIHRLTPVLNQAMGYECQLPARQAQTAEQVLAAWPGLPFIIDGTERPVRRPKDADQQRQYYSGKKKRHTVKNNVVSDKRTGKVKLLSPTVPGKQHDKALADAQQLVFPPSSQLWKDTGFQGYEPAHVLTFQPTKKPKGGDLSPSDKRLNTQISPGRIGVEHTLPGGKVFHIVADIFRNLRQGFDDLGMHVACGRHNLRLVFPLAA